MKNYLSKDFFDLTKQLIRKMRTTCLLMLVFASSLFASNVNSQVAKVSIAMKNAYIIEVIRAIENQTDYLFVYDKNQIDLTRRVDLNAENKSVAVILNGVFSNTNVVYAMEGNNIMLMQKSESQQQQKTVSGKVTDSSGEGLPGVSVVVKGTTTGTITGENGNFSLSNVPENAVLQFSFVGMKAQEIVVSGKTTINVTLAEDAIGIEEVVAVGYGTQKKVNLTGAVGLVDASELEAKPVTNVQELLQGKTPGLNITKSSGAPGSGASINIRGTSTIGGSSGVLTIIDGVPGNIYSVNPNDIESVSVLKDAASASIYGSRAANGVILITTKKGNMNSELQVSVLSSIGISNPLHFIDFLNAEDFMNLYNLARKNEGNDAFYNKKDFDDLKNGNIPDNVWYKEILKKNQILSNNHISLSGKTKKIEYNISGSYDYQEGSLPKNDYKRSIYKPDITFHATNWLSFRSNVQYTETTIDEPQGGQDNLSAATRISPITPIYTNSGLFMGPGGTPGGNPIAGIEQGGKNSNLYKEMRSIFSAKMTPIKNWNIVSQYSISTMDVKRHNYTKPVILYNQDGSVYSQDALSQQTISNSLASNKSQLLQVTSDYSYKLNEKHNFTVMAGYSQEYNTYDGFGASRKGPAFANIFVLNIAQDAKDNWGDARHDGIQSTFGRINYDFDGKYLIEANIRNDGSSRFSKGYRWGTFPSFSGGWNIHRERFLKENAPFISRLKVRGSWGILGDALKIDNYETRNLLSFNAKSYGFNGSLVGGAWSAASFQEDITWERAKMSNIGFDLSFLDNRLEVVFDYFDNVRDNILYRAPVPAEYGLTPPFTNALKMQNRGLEGMFSFHDKIKDFEYSLDFNFSYSKNKVLDLHGSGPWISGNSFTNVGTQLEMLYGYENEGLFQSPAEIVSSAKQVNVFPGNIKYKDQLTIDSNKDEIMDKADGIINGEDRVILNDKVPVRFGFNLNLKYKDLDFSMNTYGRLNNVRYIEGYEGWAFYLTTNARPMHLNSWTPENTGATYPRVTTNMTGNDREVSDFWLRNANYLKIQSIQLGYTLANTLKNKIGIDYARIYLSGQNLGILSNYDGFDPEGGYYPLARTFSLGLQLKF